MVEYDSEKSSVLIDVKTLRQQSHMGSLVLTECFKLEIVCSKPIIFTLKASSIINKSQPDPESL